MFELDQQVQLISVNARAEIHGDERKSAFDLMMSASCCADVLADFHPQLVPMLFKKPSNPDLIEQLDTHALTELKFPLLGALKWHAEYEGYTLIVAHGLGGKSDLKLIECKIDKFRILPVNGGAVTVQFRVIVHPEAKDVGKLCEKIQQEIDIKLVAPPANTVQELFGEMPPVSKTKVH
jgi:hypothetical protein